MKILALSVFFSFSFVSTALADGNKILGSEVRTLTLRENRVEASIKSNFETAYSDQIPSREDPLLGFVYQNGDKVGIVTRSRKTVNLKGKTLKQDQPYCAPIPNSISVVRAVEDTDEDADKEEAGIRTVTIPEGKYVLISNDTTLGFDNKKMGTERAKWELFCKNIDTLGDVASALPKDVLEFKELPRATKPLDSSLVEVSDGKTYLTSLKTGDQLRFEESLKMMISNRQHIRGTVYQDRAIVAYMDTSRNFYEGDGKKKINHDEPYCTLIPEKFRMIDHGGLNEILFTDTGSSYTVSGTKDAQDGKYMVFQFRGDPSVAQAGSVVNFTLECKGVKSVADIQKALGDKAARWFKKVTPAAPQLEVEAPPASDAR